MKLTAPAFGEAEIDALRECLASGWVTQGPAVARFEKLLAEKHSARHALATTSCTAALHLATMALGLGPGDEVVVPAFTWVTSANSAEYVGARAVFADVLPATFNLDPAAFEAAITPRTRAVVAVHLFGLAAEMDTILAIAGRHGIAVIEDAACAIGTSYRGRPVGAIGDVGCFSFHPRKIVTTGEGGAVTTDRDDLTEIVQSLRNHGSTGVVASTTEGPGPWTMATFDRLGYNLRLSDIQAAVGCAQMARLEGLLQERRAAAALYTDLLASVEDLATPTADAGHSFQSYVIRLTRGDRTRRNFLMSELAARDIQSRPGTHAVHRLGYYAQKYGLRPDAFPVAIQCEDTTITLPIFPGITPTDQRLVVDTITQALSRSGTAA